MKTSFLALAGTLLAACGCDQRPAKPLAPATSQTTAPAARAAEPAKAPPAGAVLLEEDFSQGMAGWWAEGARKVWVADGRLHVDSDPPKGEKWPWATVWHGKPLPGGNFRMECEAHIPPAPGSNSNNINFFLCYRDPSGKPLEATRADRPDADYGRYHQLEGYIFTFVGGGAEGGKNPDGSPKGRFRIRRCPGFKLLGECFASYSRQGHTYRIVITKQAGDLSIAVDGQEVLSAKDPAPLAGGYFGLRTFRTVLWWDNIRITALAE